MATVIFISWEKRFLSSKRKLYSFLIDVSECRFELRYILFQSLNNEIYQNQNIIRTILKWKIYSIDYFAFFPTGKILNGL